MNPTASPWGPVQTFKPITDGLGSVTTAGHGGLRLEPSAAAHLGISDACLARSLVEDGVYWFEEDCAASLLLWEVPALWQEACPHLFKEGQGESQLRDLLRQSLSRWYPDYLLERGEPLDQERYRFYRIDQEPDERVSTSTTDQSTRLTKEEER